MASFQNKRKFSFTTKSFSFKKSQISFSKYNTSSSMWIATYYPLPFE